MSPDGGTRAFGPGAVLGDRYRLERRIASGGMATVWLAHDEELDRQVAIKVLSDVLAEDPSYTERFRREARVAAGLSNPNLVRVFDYSARSERPYIAMEYVEGGTLADRASEGTADDFDSRRLARELLGALASIHAAGVIHRDVKPSNVLLDRDGSARLTDFGIAHPENATELTGTGQVLGTLKYMAPEVLAGNPATERSDLYACGVVLRECLGPGSPSELVALVDRLTADDPADRPASADEAMSLLDTSLQGAIPPTVPMGPGAGSRVVNGRRVLAVAAVLALAGALIAFALAGGGSDNGPAHRADAKQVRQRPTPPTTTMTSTTTQTDTATTTVAAPASPPPGGAAAPPACAALEAQRQQLDEQAKAAEERLKEDKTAKEQAHAQFEARKHALDDQLKACKGG
jgi:serine/threonine protein kinase